MPQLQFRDLPSTGADGLVESLSVNRPAQRCLRRCCDDRDYWHIIVVKCDRATARDALDRFRHLVEESVSVCAGQHEGALARLRIIGRIGFKRSDRIQRRIF